MVILGPGEEKTIKHNKYSSIQLLYIAILQYNTVKYHSHFSKVPLLNRSTYRPLTLFALYCTILILHYCSFVSLLILLLFQNFTILRHRTSSFASFYQHEKAGEPFTAHLFFLTYSLYAMCNVYGILQQSILYTVHMLYNAF